MRNPRTGRSPPTLPLNELLADAAFTDPRLCAAIVDRLTFNGAIIPTGAESYRLAHTKAQAEQTQAS